MRESGKKSPVGHYFLFFFLLAVLIAAAVFLLPVYRNYCRTQDELTAEREKLHRLEEERAELRAKVDDLRANPAAIEKVARERFNRVKPGETVLKDENRQKK